MFPSAKRFSVGITEFAYTPMLISGLSIVSYIPDIYNIFFSVSNWSTKTILFYILMECTYLAKWNAYAFVWQFQTCYITLTYPSSKHVHVTQYFTDLEIAFIKKRLILL